MTCSCPPHWCYARSDCRLKRPQLPRGKKPTSHLGLEPIGTLRLKWLKERHDIITAELEETELTITERRSRRKALAAIDAAIEKKEN